MCLIIQKPAGKTVSMDVIKSAANRNSDGFGIMVDGKFDKWLNIKPDTMKSKIDSLQDKNIGVHFRMATDGPINRKMAHPFKLIDDSLLMHNGVLTGYRTGSQGKVSDTVKFIQTFVNPHIKKHGTLCPETVSDAAGYSAFLLMNKEGNMERFGSGWVEHFGLHFSNEYAWNAPYKSRYAVTVNKTAKDYWDGYFDDGAGEELALDVEDQNYLAGESMRTLLIDWCDQLNPGYSDISYGDGDLLDKVFSGAITMSAFVALCDAESLLRLFAILSRDFAIARHI